MPLPLRPFGNALPSALPGVDPGILLALQIASARRAATPSLIPTPPRTLAEHAAAQSAANTDPSTPAMYRVFGPGGLFEQALGALGGPAMAASSAGRYSDAQIAGQAAARARLRIQEDIQLGRPILPEDFAEFLGGAARYSRGRSPRPGRRLTRPDAPPTRGMPRAVPPMLQGAAPTAARGWTGPGALDSDAAGAPIVHGYTRGHASATDKLTVEAELSSLLDQAVRTNTGSWAPRGRFARQISRARPADREALNSYAARLRNDIQLAAARAEAALTSGDPAATFEARAALSDALDEFSTNYYIPREPLAHQSTLDDATPPRARNTVAQPSNYSNATTPAPTSGAPGSEAWIDRLAAAEGLTGFSAAERIPGGLHDLGDRGRGSSITAEILAASNEAGTPERDQAYRNVSAVGQAMRSGATFFSSLPATLPPDIEAATSWLAGALGNTRSTARTATSTPFARSLATAGGAHEPAIGEPSPDAMAAAMAAHPAWNTLSSKARAAAGRDAMRILGPDLASPVPFVLTYLPPKSEDKAAIMASRLASSRGIPVINLADPHDRRALERLGVDFEPQPQSPLRGKNIVSRAPGRIDAPIAPAKDRGYTTSFEGPRRALPGPAARWSDPDRKAAAAALPEGTTRRIVEESPGPFAAYARILNTYGEQAANAWAASAGYTHTIVKKTNAAGQTEDVLRLFQGTMRYKSGKPVAPPLRPAPIEQDPSPVSGPTARINRALASRTGERFLAALVNNSLVHANNTELMGVELAGRVKQFAEDIRSGEFTGATWSDTGELVDNSIAGTEAGKTGKPRKWAKRDAYGRPETQFEGQRHLTRRGDIIDYNYYRKNMARPDIQQRYRDFVQWIRKAAELPEAEIDAMLGSTLGPIGAEAVLEVQSTHTTDREALQPSTDDVLDALQEDFPSVEALTERLNALPRNTTKGELYDYDSVPTTVRTTLRTDFRTLNKAGKLLLLAYLKSGEAKYPLDRNAVSRTIVMNIIFKGVPKAQRPQPPTYPSPYNLSLELGRHPASSDVVRSTLHDEFAHYGAKFSSPIATGSIPLGPGDHRGDRVQAAKDEVAATMRGSEATWVDSTKLPMYHSTNHAYAAGQVLTPRGKTKEDRDRYIKRFMHFHDDIGSGVYHHIGAIDHSSQYYGKQTYRVQQTGPMLNLEAPAPQYVIDNFVDAAIAYTTESLPLSPYHEQLIRDLLAAKPYYGPVTTQDILARLRQLMNDGVIHGFDPAEVLEHVSPHGVVMGNVAVTYTAGNRTAAVRKVRDTSVDRGIDPNAGF